MAGYQHYSEHQFELPEAPQQPEHLQAHLHYGGSVSTGLTSVSGYGSSTPAMVLCCICGTTIEANPANMCVNCVRSQVDITDGIPKQDHVSFCKNCERWHNPPSQWVIARLESKELLALCLRRLKGLNRVKLVDACFVWTEPHSRRLKVKLTIQKEVFNGTILQQAFIVEYVVNTQQCDDCQRVAAKDTWTAIVQLRQRVGHKRTILFLEQLILKHDAHTNTINIREQPDGLDFFYHHKGHAQSFVNFLTSVVPCRVSMSDKLISHDAKSNVYNYKYTYSAEVVPICRDDLVCLPHKTAQSLGSMPPIAICSRVTNQIELLCPFTLQVGAMSPQVFWSSPFRALWSASQLIMYTILDITPVQAHDTQSGVIEHRRHILADVEVARVADFGVNDIVFFGRTHLGAWLQPGDYAMGYDLTTENFVESDLAPLRQARRELPEFILVKKAYPERRRRRRARHWELRHLATENGGMEETDAARASKAMRSAERRGQEDLDEELFKQELEEDPELRAQVTLYAAKNAAELMAQQEQLPPEEEDFPEIQLSELLDNMTLAENAAPGGEQEVELTLDQAQEMLTQTHEQIQQAQLQYAQVYQAMQSHGLTPELQSHGEALTQFIAQLQDQAQQLVQLITGSQPEY